MIVTGKSDQGMLDILERRPVALTAADAKQWLDPDVAVEMAAQIARDAARPVDQFEWFEVSRELNDTWNDGPELIERKED